MVANGKNGQTVFFGGGGRTSLRAYDFLILRDGVQGNVCAAVDLCFVFVVFVDTSPKRANCTGASTSSRKARAESIAYFTREGS